MPYRTPLDIAEELGCTQQVVYKWVKEGRLRALRPGGYMYRIAEEDYQAFLQGTV